MLATVGAAAGIVGALAALAVFVWPTADGRLGHDDATRRPGGIGGSSTPGTTGAAIEGEATVTPATTVPGPPSDPAGSRRLVALTPSTGVGSAESRGDDLLMPCPSNQSDDRYRELRYDLLAPYASLTTGVGVSGPGDADATAAAQVFVQRRQDRSDRTIEVGRAVVRAGKTVPIRAELSDATSVVIRVTCAVPGQTVTLTNPRLIR
jgi:hypothetical protein